MLQGGGRPVETMNAAPYVNLSPRFFHCLQQIDLQSIRDNEVTRLMRPREAAEMSIRVLACNLKRLRAMLGPQSLIKPVRTRTVLRSLMPKQSQPLRRRSRVLTQPRPEADMAARN